MESVEESSECRNDILSQSYVRGVERVAQQDKRDSEIGFSLPKEVVERRKKDWSKFFDKYAEEVPNELELNMLTMQPVRNETKRDGEQEGEEGEEGENEDDEDENDEEHEEYYSKCRAPIRKLPALIQYWVDTGNPPYQLTGDEDHSETGSSLSEGEYSRSNESAALRKSIEDPKFDDNSACSSVDTAAYVLANGNVTKKAKTLEIVEGAKGSKEELSAKIAHKTTPIREDPNVTIVTNTVSKESDYCKTNETPKSPLHRIATPSSSVMLREVLPALQQFDELLEKSKKSKPPMPVVPKVRRIRKRCSEKSKVKKSVGDQVFSQPEKSPMETTSDLTKSTNRRKLYTGRNSPCDLIMTENTNNISPTLPVSHPALEPVCPTKKQTFASRARARRKRKRASFAPQTATLSELVRSAIRNTSLNNRDALVQDDKNNNNNNEKEGHERYTEFFESLGLTPKKVSTGFWQLPTKRKLSSMIDNRIASPPCQQESQESLESPIKDSQNSLSRNLDNSHKITSNSTNGVTEMLGNKILTVKITRLSDEVLARYGQGKSDRSVRWYDELLHQENPNIEVLTTATNDSDSSTIIICSCSQDNVDQCYDSDASVFQKMLNSSTNNIQTTEETSDLLKGISDSPKEISSISDKPKTIESSVVEASPKISAKLSAIGEHRRLVVTLEKLSLHQQQSNVTKSKIESSVESKPRDPKSPNLRNSHPVESSDPIENVSTRGFSTEPQKTEMLLDAGKVKTDKKNRFSFGFNFKTSLEGDEDCFVKPIQKKDSTQMKNKKNSENTKTLRRQENVKESLNEREENVEKIRKSYFSIATSSDEEEKEDDRVIFPEKCPSRKSPRRIERKIVHEASERSKNRRKKSDELMNDLINDNNVPAGFQNLLNKCEEKKGRDEELTKNRENDSKRLGRKRLGRKRLASSEFDEAIDTTNSSGESSHCEKTIDVRKKNKAADLNDDFIESRPKKADSNVKSSFGRDKRKRIEHETPRDNKKSAVSLALTFCTRLSIDSDSNFDAVSDEQKFVVTHKKSIKDKPISLKTDLVDESKNFTHKKSIKDKPILLGADHVNKSKNMIKKRNNINDSEKQSLAIFKDKFIEKKLEEKSSRLIPSHDSMAKDSRQEILGSPSRSKNHMKTQLGRISATKKVRRTRILGTPIDSESDDDDSEQPRINFSKSNNQNISINEKSTKRSKHEFNGSTSPNKRQDYLQNFFPDILDDSIRNIDNIFTTNGYSDRKNTKKNMKKLVEPIINRTLMNASTSTITFQTKLNTDSDNDTDL